MANTCKQRQKQNKQTRRVLCPFLSFLINIERFTKRSFFLLAHGASKRIATPSAKFTAQVAQVTYLVPHLPAASKSRLPLLEALKRPLRFIMPCAPLNSEASWVWRG